MLEATAKQVKNPLKGLKAVCYYGCMASRPPEITGAKDFEDPQALDRIIENLGATPVPWPFKTDCCGAEPGAVAPGYRLPIGRKTLRYGPTGRRTGHRGFLSDVSGESRYVSAEDRSGLGQAVFIAGFLFH